MKTSVLPAGLSLAGEIEGKGDLIVAGAVEGPIELEGTLTIDEGGEVRGDVAATALIVRGLLVGNASAKESIRVEPTAMLVGDARAPRVNIVEGARLRGRVQMTGEPPPEPRRRRRRREEAPEAARPEPPERRAQDREDRRAVAREDRPERQPAEAARRGPPREERPEPHAPLDPRATEAARRRDEAAEAERRPREERRADASEEAPRRKRRRGRRPPPPQIPGVQRQKARRKDLATEPV